MGFTPHDPGDEGKLSVHRAQIELIQDNVVAHNFPVRSHGLDATDFGLQGGRDARAVSNSVSLCRQPP